MLISFKADQSVRLCCSNILQGESLRVGYINTVGGASGDMLIASMLDLGLSVEDLKTYLRRLDVRGFELSIVKSKRAGMPGTHLDVILDHEGSEVRSIKNFVTILEASDIPDDVKDDCVRIFNLIGKAESNVHGVPEENVHLHELGTIDTLIDVVGVIAGLRLLKIDKLYCSSLPMGSGTVKTQHGLLPVPVPATAEIFKLANIPVHPVASSSPPTGEMVTPTGAAILGSIAEFSQPVFTIDDTGCGLGTKNPETYPNVLTLVTGVVESSEINPKLTLIETNIDDSTGETLGYVFDQVLSLGARDAWMTPVQMKKNRPGVQISVLVDSELMDLVIQFLLKETSTFGVRTRGIQRVEAERTIRNVQCEYGTGRVKFKIIDEREISAHPEYEDCKRLAYENQVTLRQVYETLVKKASLKETTGSLHID